MTCYVEIYPKAERRNRRTSHVEGSGTLKDREEDGESKSSRGHLVFVTQSKLDCIFRRKLGKIKLQDKIEN